MPCSSEPSKPARQFSFLIPRTMRWGAAALLVIFALAFGLHLLGGHPNLDLLIYAAAVVFIRVHGVQGYRLTTDNLSGTTHS